MLCAHCQREIEPEPYGSKEFRSPTADARKLKEAIKWYKRLKRCRRCYADQGVEAQTQLAPLVADWKAAQTLQAGGAEGVDTIDALFRGSGLAAVAEFIGLEKWDYGLVYRPGGCQGDCGTGFAEITIAFQARCAALEELLRDPTSKWRTAQHPRAYLKQATLNNSRPAKPQAGRGCYLAVCYQTPHEDRLCAEGLKQFRAILADWGLRQERHIGVFTAQLCGCTRRELLELAQDETERREIDAAWKWLYRWEGPPAIAVPSRAFEQTTERIHRLRQSMELWSATDAVKVRCAHPVVRRKYLLPSREQSSFA